MKRLTTEEYVEKVKRIHPENDHSLVVYTGASKKIIVICPKHGKFEIQANNYLQGQGCKKCGIERRSSKRIMGMEEFIRRAKEIHGDKYDYSKVVYINCDTPVSIICPEHGEFWQIPYHHLHGDSCPKCGHRVCGYTTEEWIELAKKVHGDKYDYSKANYVNANTKVCVICRIHGEFWIRPVQHLRGGGCPKCVGKHKITEDFVTESIEVHGKLYDYSKVVYKGAYVKVCIICPEHGEFWQTPHGHLNGNGCPYCKSSKLEKNIRKILKKNDINFDYQKRFPWLGLQSLDFYLPDYNVAIECQGRQHFESVDIFGGEESLRVNKERDVKKYYKCKNKGVNILYITFPEYMVYKYIDVIYNELVDNEQDLLKKIISLTKFNS